MLRTFSFLYSPCQSCAQKINCDRCESLLREKLLAQPEISSVQLQMAKKQLTVDAALDHDELLDALEDLGIFIM